MEFVLVREELLMVKLSVFVSVSSHCQDFELMQGGGPRKGKVDSEVNTSPETDISSQRPTPSSPVSYRLQSSGDFPI